MAINELFEQQLKVINVGLESFKDALDQVNTPAVQVEWKPPIAVDPAAVAIIAQHRETIRQANDKVMEIILSGIPFLTGMGIAREVIPGMTEDTILHAGPPISWDRMCGPMRGAVMGALIYEGRAATPEEAGELAASGTIQFSPCHEHCTVGPMAGVVSPSMPVFILENQTFGNNAYCTMNEGLGKVLRYGAYSEEVIERLRWMQDTLYPILKSALAAIGPLNMKNIIAQALHMGDEVHNRNRAGTSLLYRALAPAVVRTATDKEAAAQTLDFIQNNDHFFLNLSMPACKVTLDAARNIPGSSVAVVMCRNGTDFGVQLAGTGDQWFTGPADVPDALFFPGYTKEDANPDIGDSSITETNGLGGFAIAAAPAIVQFVGGSAADAIRYTKQMYEITVTENNAYQVPYLNFRGTPTGIDVTKVIEKNILPFIDTGVAHRLPGIGQVGAGVLSASLDPFKRAYEGLAEQLKGK
jgi:hypothetical protein